MRRSLAVVVAAGLAFTMIGGQAFARSLTVRSDSNDTPGPIDIRKVGSDVTRRGVILQIGVFQRFAVGDNARFVILLDTRGTRDHDQLVEITRSSGRYTCITYGSNDDMIGVRRGTRPDGRSVRCRLPTGWFDIAKTVRFVVLSDHRHDDRAPDRGWYLGL